MKPNDLEDKEKGDNFLNNLLDKLKVFKKNINENEKKEILFNSSNLGKWINEKNEF